MDDVTFGRNPPKDFWVNHASDDNESLHSSAQSAFAEMNRHKQFHEGNVSVATHHYKLVSTTIGGKTEHYEGITGITTETELATVPVLDGWLFAFVVGIVCGLVAIGATSVVEWLTP